ncbi:MAG: PhzF family phenazine biosynthesis protein [Firmicutes bacterium]|jgi:trans-2,3-dihydro-3-hydroxyanthranilate isomerase|nr:PhzF family phenazine biosynthesis protein [Bacillota bacterium]
MGRVFHLVDVFAESPLSGNQLAVFTDGEGLSASEMQRIAREINFSETTFVTGGPDANGGVPVRIFTPAEEVPFAGHPTLGTAYVIREIMGLGRDETVLNLAVGPIRVVERTSGGTSRLYMTQNSPTFGETMTADEAASLLGLEPGDVRDDLPVQAVSTGLPFFIVPLRSLKALQRAWISSRSTARDHLASRDAQQVLVFTTETHDPECQLSVRVFCPDLGVLEDPATGSGNGCLAGYLVHHNALQSEEIRVVVEQGMEIGRPSRLYLEAERAPGGGIIVRVGGRVIPVACGEWY